MLRARVVGADRVEVGTGAELRLALDAPLAIGDTVDLAIRPERVRVRRPVAAGGVTESGAPAGTVVRYTPPPSCEPDKK